MPITVGDAAGVTVLRVPLHPVYDRRTGSLLHYTIYDRGYIHVSGWVKQERGRGDRGGEWHCIGECMAGVERDASARF